MTSIGQEQLLDDLAQDLVVLDGRVYLAQQVFPGNSPEQTHLIEMQSCVRRMIEQLQAISRFEATDSDSAIPTPSPHHAVETGAQMGWVSDGTSEGDCVSDGGEP